MNVYLSSGAFRGASLGEMLEVCRQVGAGLELGSAIAFGPQEEQMLIRTGSDVPLLVHNYFPAPEEPFVLNLASPNPAIHARSMEHCRRAIELCSRLGAPFYSVHAGFALHLDPEDLGNPVAQRDLPRERRCDRSVAYRCFLETVGLLADFAAERDVRLLVENNVCAKENLDEQGESPLLLSCPDEICRFFSELEKGNVGLLFDTGHAKVTAKSVDLQVERFLEQILPHVFAFHLSDNDGLRDTNEPFDSSSWFMPYLRQVPDVPMVIEVYRLTTGALLAQHQCLESMSDKVRPE